MGHVKNNETKWNINFFLWGFIVWYVSTIVGTTTFTSLHHYFLHGLYSFLWSCPDDALVTLRDNDRLRPRITP